MDVSGVVVHNSSHIFCDFQDILLHFLCWHGHPLCCLAAGITNQCCSPTYLSNTACFTIWLFNQYLHQVLFCFEFELFMLKPYRFVLSIRRAEKGSLANIWPWYNRNGWLGIKNKLLTCKYLILLLHSLFSLTYDITDTDCWTQHGSTQGHTFSFTTVKHNIQDEKLSAKNWGCTSGGI